MRGTLLTKDAFFGSKIDFNTGKLIQSAFYISNFNFSFPLTIYYAQTVAFIVVSRINYAEYVIQIEILHMLESLRQHLIFRIYIYICMYYCSLW